MAGTCWKLDADDLDIHYRHTLEELGRVFFFAPKPAADTYEELLKRDKVNLDIP